MLRHFHIIERPAFALHFLIGFMSFTSNEHNILVIRLLNGPGNGLLPIMEHLGLGLSGHTSQDILDNLLGRFSPWVVISHNQMAAVSGSGPGHQRPFGPVAVTTATKHTPELARL